MPTKYRKIQFSLTQAESSQIESGITFGRVKIGVERGTKVRNNHRKIKDLRNEELLRAYPAIFSLQRWPPPFEVPFDNRLCDRPLFTVVLANCFTTPLAHAKCWRVAGVFAREKGTIFFLPQKLGHVNDELVHRGWPKSRFPNVLPKLLSLYLMREPDGLSDGCILVPLERSCGEGKRGSVGMPVRETKRFYNKDHADHEIRCIYLFNFVLIRIREACIAIRRANISLSSEISIFFVTLVAR